MIQHRATQEKFDIVMRVLSCMESEFVKLSYKEHDRITADTQAVTHVAFLRYDIRDIKFVFYFVSNANSYMYA